MYAALFDWPEGDLAVHDPGLDLAGHLGLPVDVLHHDVPLGETGLEGAPVRRRIELTDLLHAVAIIATFRQKC